MNEKLGGQLVKNLFFLLRALTRQYAEYNESADAPQRFKDAVAESERLQAESRRAAKERKAKRKAMDVANGDGDVSSAEDDNGDDEDQGEDDDDERDAAGTGAGAGAGAEAADDDSDDGENEADEDASEDKPKSGLLWILKQLAFVGRRGGLCLREGRGSSEFLFWVKGVARPSHLCFLCMHRGNPEPPRGCCALRRV